MYGILFLAAAALVTVLWIFTDRATALVFTCLGALFTAAEMLSLFRAFLSAARLAAVRGSDAVSYTHLSRKSQRAEALRDFWEEEERRAHASFAPWGKARAQPTAPTRAAVVPSNHGKKFYLF